MTTRYLVPSLRLLILFLLLLAPRTRLVAADGGAETSGPPGPLVTGHLLTDTLVAAPGDSLELGVQLVPRSGWHLYWRNPGDAGLPTRLRFELDPRLRGGEIRWPLPEALPEPGGVTVFGYTAPVVLLRTLEVASDVATGVGSLPVRVRIDWLACKESCVPGQTTLEGQVRLGERRRPGVAAPLRVAAGRVPEVGAALPVEDLGGRRFRVPLPEPPGVQGPPQAFPLPASPQALLEVTRVARSDGEYVAFLRGQVGSGSSLILAWPTGDGGRVGREHALRPPSLPPSPMPPPPRTAGRDLRAGGPRGAR